MITNIIKALLLWYRFPRVKDNALWFNQYATYIMFNSPEGFIGIDQYGYVEFRGRRTLLCDFRRETRRPSIVLFYHVIRLNKQV